MVAASAANTAWLRALTRRVWLTSARARVDKCRFCTVSALNGTEMSTCVTACPAGVRVFGDLDDPDSEVSKVLAATHATPLLGDATKSKIFYVR